MSRLLAGLFVFALACTSASSDTSVPAPSGASSVPSSTPASATPSATPSLDDATRLVQVGGIDLALTCEGSGSLTVLLEAGLGTDSSTWATIQDDLAAQTRTCSYDRAGLGESEARPGGERIPAEDVVEELQGMLTAAGEAGPFVVVGHSYGGMLARLFAAAYPEQVVGLVLEDAVHEDTVCDAAVLGSAEDCAVWQDGPTLLDMTATVEALRAAGDLDGLPLVVLSHGVPLEREAAERLWQDSQEALAGLSSDAVHVVASDSGHSIHDDQPELLVAASLDVVRAARDESRLGRCARLFPSLGGECL